MSECWPLNHFPPENGSHSFEKWIHIYETQGLIMALQQDLTPTSIPSTMMPKLIYVSSYNLSSWRTKAQSPWIYNEPSKVAFTRTLFHLTYFSEHPSYSSVVVINTSRPDIHIWVYQYLYRVSKELLTINITINHAYNIDIVYLVTMKDFSFLNTQYLKNENEKMKQISFSSSKINAGKNSMTYMFNSIDHSRILFSPKTCLLLPPI
jgi:hypothetical protein